MIGRARAFGEQPINDGDRRRLFLMLTAVVVTAGAVLFAVRSDPRIQPRRPSHPKSAPRERATVAPPRSLTGHIDNATQPIRTVRAFLHAYLQPAYGHRAPRRIPDATPALERHLADLRRAVSVARGGRHPRVLSLRIGRCSAGLTVRALIAEGGVAYDAIALTLVLGREGWLVAGVSGR